jgi:hypothetical protein
MNKKISYILVVILAGSLSIAIMSAIGASGKLMVVLILVLIYATGYISALKNEDL